MCSPSNRPSAARSRSVVSFDRGPQRGQGLGRRLERVEPGAGRQRGGIGDHGELDERTAEPEVGVAGAERADHAVVRGQGGKGRGWHVEAQGSVALDGRISVANDVAEVVQAGDHGVRPPEDKNRSRLSIRSLLSL
ncbi:hypothetical protein GCM10028864_29910 [Microlunatus parietis]